MKKFAQETTDVIKEPTQEISKVPEQIAEQGLKGGDVPEWFYVRQIQLFINQLPWEYLNKPNPKLNVTPTIDNPTQKALDELAQIAQDLNSFVLSDSIRRIKAGDLKTGADQLFDAKNEINKLIKHQSEFLKEVGDKDWTYQEKIQHIRLSKYPSYFPKPWQPRNIGSYVTGDSRNGQFKCGPPGYEKIISTVNTTPDSFRICQTPDYNHFLMWGPECWNCGINGPDPRFYMVKAKYPDAFSYTQIKRRLENHEWSPLISSPGVRPYIVPPPQGSSYYSNPNNPQTKIEGVRFFDAEDEKEYYRLEKLYYDFKAQEESSAKTYNDLYLNYYKHKQKKSPYSAPNVWSKEIYSQNINNIVKLAELFEKFVKKF